MRLLATLDHLADDSHPRRAQQLAQLVQVLAVGQRRYAEGALARALGLRHQALSRDAS